MIIFWIVEYQRNENITLVEYKSTREIQNLSYPELSICFDQPFLNTELVKFNPDLDKNRYLEHLKSKDGFNETYNDIPYDEVTPNLFGHLNRLWIGWKPGRYHSSDNCTDIEKCSYFIFSNNYNGMSDFTFIKCFGIQVHKNYIHDVNWFQLIFDESLGKILTQIKGVFVMMNQPNQFARNMGGVQNIWDPSKGKKRKEYFQITSIDILIRRNKIQSPCMDDWRNYDSLVLNHHTESVGCRAPYHKMYDKYPICKTQNELKRSIFDPWSMDNTDFSNPCQEMPNIEYKHDFKDTNIDPTVRQTFKIWVAYPKKGKVITESRAVNIHSLIGNIGGYIGLFLGKYNYIEMSSFMKNLLIA